MTVSFRSTHIRDPKLRAAAETVDKHTGTKNDREVTSSDLDDAEQLIAKHKAALAAGTPNKSPLKDVHAVAIAQLEEALPELRKHLGQADTARGLAAPFCTSMGTAAIADDDVRACAAAIAKALDGKGELSLASFLDARDVFRGKATDDGPAATQKVKDLLGPLIKDGTIDAERLDALDVFFLTGQGGIMSHGPIRISGRTFDDVYRLPKLDASDEKTIAAYEKRFADCGYDRLYIKGDNGDVYLALHEKGEMSAVKDGYRVSMRNDLHQRDSGEVLAVVDVTNSWTEATIGVWKRTLTKVVDAAFGAVGIKADKRIEAAANGIADAVVPEAEKTGKRDLATIAVAVTSVTAYSALLAAVPIAAVGVGVAALGLTGASVAKFALQKQDKTSIFHALGIGVNRSEPVT